MIGHGLEHLLIFQLKTKGLFRMNPFSSGSYKVAFKELEAKMSYEA
jgi:hypothetical protein